MFGLMGQLTWLLVRIVLSILFCGTPLIGLWVASSLAAYLGGPPWMAWAAGALLFPLIPGFWEFDAWTRRRPESKAWFTLADRISMRTFVVGLAFLIGLLYFYPQAAFVALSTRGDWMLDGIKDPRAQTARRYLFASAGGLEWLYHATRKNPFKAHIDEKARKQAAEAARQAQEDLDKQRKQEAAQKQEQKQPGDKQIAERTEAGQKQEVETAPQKQAQRHELETAEKPQGGGGDKQQPASESAKQQVVAQRQEQETTAQERTAKPEVRVEWPWKQATLHPAVAKMPHSAETSIQSVAQYIARHESDPVQRIKALHDYVADRIAYDADAFYSDNYPDQDAEAVFTARKGVCAGYANLLSALASAINEEIVVVYGDARDPATGDKLTGSGHAWNAARINGHWYLIDACWDAGTVSREKGFTKRYRTDYLLPPPKVMIQDHFPEEGTWQLLAQPLSQGEFLRQPMLHPAFQAADLTLMAPQCVVNETQSKAEAVVKNPKSEWLMASLQQDNKPIGYSTTPTNNKTAQLEYPLPGTGKYRLNLWANQSRYGDYQFVGSMFFVNR